MHRKSFKIGETLYGFCSGYFGRDSYDDKIVEKYGKDWVVCRGEDGLPQFARFSVSKYFWERVDEWRNKQESG